MQQAGTVTLLGRANTQLRPQNRQAAYQLRINNTGAWSITKHTTTNADTTLASGAKPALGLNTWHTIKLGFSGTQITATLDGATLGTVNDSSYLTGQVGLGVRGYQTDQFDNLTVTPNAGPTPPAQTVGVLRGQESGRCVDVPSATETNGTVVALWDCKRRRQPVVDLNVVQTTDRVRQQVPRRQWSGYRRRHSRPHLGLHRRQQPAMEPQRRRHDRRRGFRQVPRRHRPRHRQRHPDGDLDLHRRRQPEVGPHLSRT